MEVFSNGQMNQDAVMELFKTHSAAIFDMDGTLLDSMTVWHDIDNLFLERYGSEPDSEFQRLIAKMTLDTAALKIQEYYKIPRTPKQIMAEFLELIGDYYYHKLPLKPGALELLQSLHEQGVRIMVATANEYDISYAALKRTGVLQYAEGVVTCSMAKAGKDSPAVYFLACEKMKKTVSDCVIFEDSLYAMQTAGDCGFDVVAVFDEESKEDWNDICKISKCQVVF